MEGVTFLRLINPVLKFLGFAKKKSEKKYSIYRVYKQLNVSANSEDFDSVFNQSLYEFEKNHPTHPDIIKLFKKPSAKEAFRREYYNKSGDDFYVDLDTNLHTDIQFSELVGQPVNLENDIREFLRIFDAKVNESRTPKEIQTAEGLKQIQETVNELKLFINNKNIYIPEQLKEIAELRKNNNHNAVLNLLNNLKDKNWDTLTPELQYSVLLHLAATYIDLSDKKKAANYFIQLPDLNLKPEEALGYASLGYALLGETEKSIEFAHKAIGVNPNDLNAYLGLLFSKEDTIEIEEIDILIPKHLQENPQIAINIGTFLEKKLEYDKAFEVFEKLNSSYAEMDSFKCDILVQLGTNRMHAIANKEDYLFNQMDEDEMLKVSYAHDCFEKAWNYLKSTDLRFSRWYVLTNKGVTNKVLGRKNKAEKDFTDSLELKKTYFTYRHLLIMKIDARENLDELIVEIEKLKLKEEEIQEMAVFKADKLFSEGKSEEALNILLTHFPKITSQDLKRQIGSMIIETYLRMSNFTEADVIALQLAEEFPEDPLSFYNLSKTSYHKGDSEKGQEYLHKSASLISQKTPKFIALPIVEQLVNQNELVAAAEALEIIANPNVNSNLTQKLINIYYQCGNHKRAMSIVEHLLKENPDDPFLVDVSSSISETNENYDKAISVVTDFLSRHPENKFMRVKLSMNCYKKGDYAIGAQELDKIKDFSEIPLQVQFLIAHLYIKNKEYTKGLSIAYSLRSKNYADPSAHSRYIQCTTGMEDLGREVYFPEIVSKDCYVVLRDDAGKLYTYILVDSPESQNEIAINEVLGQTLIDKRISDVINWNGESLRIESILWKYTYALHDSMDQLYLRFGNSQPIKVFRVKPSEEPTEQFQDIFKMIDSAHDFDKEVEQLYRQGKTTIGVNARLSGVNPIKYWGKLVSSYDNGIVSIGTTLEFQIGMQQLALGKPLILDITALLTCFHTKSFHLLEKLGNHKIITRSTLEVLENEIADIKTNLESDTMIVNKQGGQYFRRIVTKEDKEKQLDILSDLYEKINKVCQVVTPQLSENFKEKEKNDGLFGKSFNESLIVSKELDGILLSDDVFLRTLAFNEWRINGISTFIMAIYLERNRLIEGAETEIFLEKLIKLNYRNIPSNPKLLFRLFRDSDFKIQQPFINACEFISPTFLNDVQAARFIVDFLLEVYLSTSITSSRTFVTQFILSKLFSGRNSFLIKKYLFALLDSRFKLLPNQKDEIIEITKSF